MRMDIERVFLRVEARRALRTALISGERCPTGCTAILANDTLALEEWDEIQLEQWRLRHGLAELVSGAESLGIAAYGVGG